MKNASCLDCEFRKVGCHSNCTNYELYIKKLNTIKKEKLYEQQMQCTHKFSTIS